MVKNNLTVEKLMHLPYDIKEISSKNEYVGLLSEDIIDSYYTETIKKKIFAYIKKFNNYKYMYNSSIDYCISSRTYTEEIKLKNHQNKSVVEELVTKSVDIDMWLEEAYNHLIKLSYKLNINEANYFVEAFFKHTSEEAISEIIGISCKTLQNIKKSCLIKLYIEIGI